MVDMKPSDVCNIMLRELCCMDLGDMRLDSVEFSQQDDAAIFEVTGFALGTQVSMGVLASEVVDVDTAKAAAQRIGKQIKADALERNRRRVRLV